MNFITKFARLGNVIKIYDPKNETLTIKIVKQEKNMGCVLPNIETKDLNENMLIDINYDYLDGKICLLTKYPIFNESKQYYLKNGTNFININKNLCASNKISIYVLCIGFNTNSSFVIKKMATGSEQDNKVLTQNYSDTHDTIDYFNTKKIYADVNLTGIKHIKQLTQLKQCDPISYIYISPTIRHILSELKIVQFLKKFNVKEYKKGPNYHIMRDTSTLFVGVFTKEDENMIQNHGGLRFLLWCETDSDSSVKSRRNTITIFKNVNNIFHLCSSNISFRKLKQCGITPHVINVDGVLDYAKSGIVGNLILIYEGFNNKEHQDYTIIQGLNHKLDKKLLSKYDIISSRDVLHEGINNACLVVSIIKSPTNEDTEYLKSVYNKNVPVFSADSHNDKYVQTGELSDTLNKISSYVSGIDTMNDIVKNCEDLVTVIITTFNRDDTICNAIDSILNQSHKNLKIIVIDDKSTDKTMIKLKKYLGNEKITIIQNNSNKGTYYCKNIGLSLMDVNTKYYTFQDSDDISHPLRIQIHLYNMIKTNSDCSISLMTRGKNLKICYITQMYHINVFNYLGYFDSSTRFGADSEYVYRFFKYNDIDCTDLNKGYSYALETQKNPLYKNSCSYCFVPIVLYFVKDSREDNLTKIYPLGKYSRATYLKKYRKKISKMSKSDLKYNFVRE